MEFIGMLPLFVAIAICLVVVFTELVKKFDKKEKLKGYRVWIPLLFSFFFSWLLYVGAFFAPRELWFWWATIFGISTFFYEAILKKIQTAFADKK